MEAPNYILLALISIIAYFLRDLHSRLKDTIKDKDDIHDKVNKLESKVVRLEEKMPSDIQHLETVINLKLDEVTKTIQHLEKSLNNQAEAYVTLLKEHTKK